MKHTKGPWKVNRIDKSYRIRQTDNLNIGNDSDLDQLDANVHLIAAAPEMLEALEFIRDEMRARGKEIWIEDRMLDQVIKKAKGDL